MAVLPDLIDETRLLLSLVEKTLIKTEEVQCGGDTGEGAVEGARNLLDFFLATRELKRVAGDLNRIAEDIFTSFMGDQHRHTIDGTTVEVRRSYRRTDWEHAKLATHIALRALGGEVVEGMDLVVDAFVTACRPEWRITALKDMGLSDEDYCSRELGRPTVTVL